MSQIERLYWIDREIREHRYPNARAVCDRFEVRPRTAYTDRDHLIQRLGAPLVFDRARGGWAYRDPTYVLPFLALTDREAAALRRSLLAAHASLPPADAASVLALAERLAPYAPPLDPTAPGGPESLAGAVRPARDVGVPEGLLDDCRRATLRRHRLRLLYHSLHRDEVKERVVRPCHLLYWRGEPYLIAWCEWRQNWRQFFLGRVREWALLPGPDAFAPDPAFDVNAYLARGLDLMHGPEPVTVRARFSPRQARWVRERRYHDSQETEELADGGLVLTLRVAGTAEVRRWLLGYGAEVEVLEPAGLRAEVAAEAEKLAKIYGGDAECSHAALSGVILEEEKGEDDDATARIAGQPA